MEKNNTKSLIIWCDVANERAKVKNSLHREAELEHKSLSFTRTEEFWRHPITNSTEALTEVAEPFVGLTEKYR